MFICFGEELYKTRVTISETCTASELIAHTLKQYTQETNKIPDPNEPEGYVMSAANPDGTKDLEWPFGKLCIFPTYSKKSIDNRHSINWGVPIIFYTSIRNTTRIHQSY